MQDVTGLDFWRLLSRYGGPDLYYTEYFRVYPNSRLDKSIVRSILEVPDGKPVIAQMIGNEIPELIRIARDLQRLPIAGIDLNLGCPAPVVYRKCAGGGLLRSLESVDAILGALREVISIPFSVKTRVGFDGVDRFDELLAIFARHSVDLVTVHGRTVQEMYRSDVRYELIAKASQVMRCPVLANGNVVSAAKAAQVLKQTGVRGLMIGRGAVRNPWIFTQIRKHLAGESYALPTGRDVLQYVLALYESTSAPALKERNHLQRMKKYLNYLGLGVEPTGEFLHRVRRVTTEHEFLALCHRFLDHNDPMPLEPFVVPLGERDVLAGVQG